MIWGAIVIGLAAGLIGGLLGVGGGALFVPGLALLLGLGQHRAEATSLLAVLIVALVGALAQDRYGNVQRRDALTLGALGLFGTIGGVVAANALSSRVLRDAFAGLLVVVAIRLVLRTRANAGTNR